MPNWNFNSVVITAPISKVMPYFIQEEKNPGNTGLGYMFNMHMLFPDKFPKSDPYGFDNWDYDWFVDNTGSKWIPSVYITNVNDDTHLHYDSAWVPNNLALLKLSKLIGCRIENNYEEPGQWFEGCFICENGAVVEDHDGPYRPDCCGCGEKFDENELRLDEEISDWICSKCDEGNLHKDNKEIPSWLKGTPQT